MHKFIKIIGTVFSLLVCGIFTLYAVFFGFNFWSIPFIIGAILCVPGVNKHLKLNRFIKAVVLVVLFIGGNLLIPLEVVNEKYPEDNVSSTSIADSDTSKEQVGKKDSLNSEKNTTTDIKVIDNNSENDTTLYTDTNDKKRSSNNEISDNSNASLTNSSLFEGYTLINVYGGNFSGTRKASVVVDIGYGDREYWAFTNEYGQLVKVVADEIIPQDDSAENVNADGRYYDDEANVPGTEQPNYDQGHVIADSLGGVSNAYNITPQDSTLNRYGDQAYMEKVIRDAGGCSDFVAVITYPNTETQIPSHYSFTYTLMGNVINDEFDNINPEGDPINDNSSIGSNSNNGVDSNLGNTSNESYVGNSNTYKFHYSSCSSVKDMKEHNKVFGESRDYFINNGYKPCKRCNP